MGSSLAKQPGWRISHKLMLGLGLVVLLMALLLGGTLRGLWSYYITMNNIRAKLAELNVANALKEEIVHLADEGTLKHLVDFPGTVTIKTAKARERLQEYREQLEVTRQKTEAEDSHEVALVAVLAGNLDEFEALVPRQALPRMRLPGQEAPRLNDKLREEMETTYQAQRAALRFGMGALAGQPWGPLTDLCHLAAGPVPPPPLPLLRVVHETTLNAGDLQEIINKQLNEYLSESRRHYQISLWIIVPASIVGLLSVIGLMRSFYSWIFNPIRDLEAGVKRVARGDFQNPIRVDSGDEMEDLAEAFNDMMARLAELYNDLARQVNERSRQLVRSERLASVGYLAAGVAHEINNPLHSIALYSEALEARLADLLSALPLTATHARELELISRYLRMIQEEAFRCKKITERLLEFSRPGERKRETTDLVGLLQSVIDSVQVLPHSQGKTITLNGNGSANAASALINAEEIRSVLLNLAINAMENMEEGGELRIAVTPRNGMVELCFTDTGCGMTPEVLENIFEPFFTRNRTGKGTGLGLTISHRIIEQHGGEIEATSPGPNLGSTFIVRLPLHVEPVPERPPVQPLDPRGNGRQAA